MLKYIMLKKELVFSVFGILALIALLIFFSNQYNLNLQSLKKAPALTQTQNQTQSIINLSLEEVQKHNNYTNCWTIINDNVYDVTQYVNQHPGGSFTISDYCGSDMTNAFLTKGGRGTHSSLADELHATMLLGSLGEQINLQTINNIQNQPQQSRGGGSGND